MADLTDRAMDDAVAAWLPWAASHARAHPWPWAGDPDSAFSAAMEAVWRGIEAAPDDPEPAAVAVYRCRQVDESRSRSRARRIPPAKLRPLGVTDVPAPDAEEPPDADRVALAGRLAAGFEAERRRERNARMRKKAPGRP